MKLINRQYISLFEYLSKKNFPLMRWIHEKIDRDAYIAMKTGDEVEAYGKFASGNILTWGQQFVGAFQPVISIIHDFEYTFKPYSMRSYIWLDAFQPFVGIINVFRGVLSPIIAPLLFLKNTVKYSVLALYRGTSEGMGDKISKSFLYSFSWVTDGFFSLLRGAIQIATTPLTWFIRMPLRIAITRIKGVPQVNENEEIQSLLKEAKIIVTTQPTNGGSLAKILQGLEQEAVTGYINSQPGKSSWSEIVSTHYQLRIGNGKNYPVSENAEKINHYLKLFEISPIEANIEIPVDNSITI